LNSNKQPIPNPKSPIQNRKSRQAWNPNGLAFNNLINFQVPSKSPFLSAAKISLLQLSRAIDCFGNGIKVFENTWFIIKICPCPLGTRISILHLELKSIKKKDFLKSVFLINGGKP
jgi:hypothetical protein